MTTPPAAEPPPPYGTPAAPHVTVRGEAHLDTDPDLARVAVTLTARGRDRRTTLDDLTHRNTTVLDLLKSCGDALERLETGALTVTPELTPRGRGERVRTHHGTVHLTADLNDFTALGELTTRLADLDLTRVDGPWWLLRPDSPAHRLARQQAVRDAVQRAREYAEALGTSLDALVELGDTGTDHHPHPETRARSMAFAAATEDAPPPPLDLEPQRQRLYAEVTARFTLRPPRL
ncbi:SIMPL domain-containing protein [Streptomyces sp. NPDC007904]|uniref:SIMPL domain-containing protein n=1 Tax=Streptomyces sp. NPDC007904 TaxID=3364787 RepID=UPI0036EFE974